MPKRSPVVIFGGGFIVLCFVVVIIGQSLKEELHEVPMAPRIEEPPVVQPPKPVPPEQKKPIAIMDVAELVKEYAANEIRADSKWKGRFIGVIGEVQDIGTDIAGRPYMMLRTMGSRTRDPGKMVQTFVEDDEGKKEIAKVSKGDGVGVVGRCDGRVMISGQVMLTNSRLSGTAP